jgi:hypothetical protein
MSWILEIPTIVRTWINDWDDNPTYSDDRLQQVIVVAGQYVTREINLDTNYECDVLNLTITPDPSLSNTRDEAFISFVSLKSACILDQSTFRTKAASEGIRAGLGAASISVGGSLKGYKDILDTGPCKMYEKLRMEHEIGNANSIKAILSPFVGNNFDPRYLNTEYARFRDFYS